MSACLYIMDDSIRLLEWLAYHYTVLPLSHLIVAIDPRSRNMNRLVSILQSYKSIIKVDVYTEDEEWMTGLKDTEGWGRQIYSSAGQVRDWFNNTDDPVFKSQSHKRRQNYFMTVCLKRLFESGSRKWTILMDSDEFLVYNYRHINFEKNSTFDAANDIVTKDDIQVARKRIIPLREKLPLLSERFTIADYLHNYISSNFPKFFTPPDLKGLSKADRQALRLQGPKDHALETAGVKIDRPPRCFRFPHLQFSSYEEQGNDRTQSLLLTHRQTLVGPLSNQFSKAMIDLSQAKSADWFDIKNVVNVHTPSRRMCGRISKQVEFSGSGTDYLSSLFRIHHYRSGTLETYLERSADYRGSGLWRFYTERNIRQPVATITDIYPWVDWFTHKVGNDAAKELLFDPFVLYYQEYHSTDSSPNNSNTTKLTLLYQHAQQVLERWQQEGRLSAPDDTVDTMN
eukprot:CAMPEP_0194140586 /NCGR_PEP_ID=MMETSP0152-20130528/10115_1 /TAXON_ID=1049557 /ORGANISM="Thalassiothrix antarctica, Strain L6-D1" /LENGTH=454 /DNA_ID=CAMNT_0038838889 /DNA_START=331 /DNA_END=1695 /DNA_ORIENTATION=+